MDQQKLQNVAIADPPTVSRIPVRPRLLLNFALGLFTAIFMACGAVLIAEMLREDIRTPGELEAFRGCPVLATAPLRPGRGGLAEAPVYRLPRSRDERSATTERLLPAEVFRRRNASGNI